MSGDTPPLRIRHGSLADVQDVLRFMDEAVAWLAGRGQTGQWGTEPISGRASFVERLEHWQREGGLRIAETGDGEPVGALVVGGRQPYVPEAGEPELYVILLVTSRRHAGRGVGSLLVRRAIDEARERGVRLLRVDCWAGAPRLVAWYEEQGFVPTERFHVGAWEGQLFELRIDA
jgi:GNAT superfamily N-acetyltransferase